MTEALPVSEIVLAAARDNHFYERHFFPKTVRQLRPYFHEQMDEVLWGSDRYVGFKVFRGGAKTTKLRLFTSKRIAYGISHTILFVSNAQDHSIKSIEWLKRNVEFNRKWADTYQLRKGGKWSSDEIEIIHGVDEFPIRVMALGITGQLRGVNVDDWRPDLIVVDDPDNEETTGTAEQIKKTTNLFFGALAKSLAPASEAPSAKMVLLQTPLTNGDIIDIVAKDPQWRVLEFGCFDEHGQSRWEDRFPTKELLADKESHIQRGQLSLWMREMECAIVPDGGTSFVPENIKTYDLLPDQLVYIITIDPASSDSKTADDQVIMVVGLSAKGIYVVEYSAEKGEMPEMLIQKLFEYARRYSILGIWVESISYQRVLAHLIAKAMKQHRIFIPVHQVQDKRSKANRIVQAIGRAAGYGQLYIRSTMQKLLEQYTRYSPKTKEHDDVLDALAMAIDVSETLQVQDWIEGEAEVVYEVPQKQIGFRQCP